MACVPKHGVESGVEVTFAGTVEPEGLHELVARRRDADADPIVDDAFRWPILLAVSDSGPQITFGSTQSHGNVRDRAALSEVYPGARPDRLGGALGLVGPDYRYHSRMSALRVVIATSNPHGNAARICHHLAQSTTEVDIVGALVDTRSGADRGHQLRRLQAWRRHGGLRYVLWRVWLQLRPRELGPASVPRYSRSLHDLGAEFGFPVVEVPNLNGPDARRALAESRADLGISIGNRAIEEAVFTLPALGMINLHHGMMPTYRGGPAAFWEIYYGEQTMGISVHRIDSQLDHGDLLGIETVPIRSGETPADVMERAYAVDHRLVERVVNDLARGTARPIPIELDGTKVMTFPSRAQLRALRKRLGRPITVDDSRRAHIPVLPD